MDTLIKDIRYGFRSLIRRPAFTALAIFTLAIGIGAATSIFTVVDGVLLRPLPYPRAEQLVQLREVNNKGIQIPFTEPNYLDIRARTNSFAAMAQYNGDLTTVTGASEPVRAQVFAVSSGFFDALDVKPILGRTFSAEESRRGGPPVAVVSYGFWKRLLGGQSDLTGISLDVSDQRVSVIGVMPADFAFPKDAEIWIPRELFPTDNSRTAHNWSVVARLNSNTTIQQARAELNEIGRQLQQEHGSDTDAVDFAAVPQQEYMVKDVRRALFMIFAAVGFLLLVACANVANLLLAQVTTRQRDFAVRTALGATRLRLARQFITENILLVLGAGVAGVLLSLWGVDLLVALNQESLPRSSEIGVDARAIGFTLLLSLAIGTILGIVPLLRYSGKDLETVLREAGTGARGYAGSHLRSVLVVAQMALTLVLLVGAGLLGKSFYRLLQVDPGFKTESAVAMEVSLPEAPPDDTRYEQLKQSEELIKQGKTPTAQPKLSAAEEKQRLFQQQLLERLRTTPGVVSVGTINRLPLTGGGPNGMFLINNNPELQGYADYRLVAGDYFGAMRIPLLRGRSFAPGDDFNTPNAAVISQSLAQKYWPNQDPLGQAIQFGNMDGDIRLLHVVGVVGDVHDSGVDEKVYPTVYANAQQRFPRSTWTVIARAQVDPATLTPVMSEAVRSLDSNLPLKFRTLDQIFSSSLDAHRFSLVIFGAFGVAALLLAALGIYGVTTYTVAQRTQEIGIRMALGAQVGDVIRLVLGNAMALVVIGAIVGLAGAYAITRVMSHLLFEVTPTDLFTFVAVPLLLLIVALVACLVPARRATRVDPMVALRNE